MDAREKRRVGAKAEENRACPRDSCLHEMLLLVGWPRDRQPWRLVRLAARATDAYLARVTDARLEAALARLQRATDRIERAAEGAGASGGNAALDALRRRHERLRGRVSEAVGRLNALMAESGG